MYRLDTKKAPKKRISSVLQDHSLDLTVQRI